MLQLMRFPREIAIEASAPLRIEVGTFLDQLPIATLYHREGMHTATISIAMYIRMRISPLTGDVIRIRSGNQHEDYTHPLPLDSRFGILNACLTHFDTRGAEISYDFDAPTHSGLGGSSILMTLTCASLMSAEQPELFNEVKIQSAKISVMLENVLFAPTGYQDQMSSIYGGVQLFRWKILEAIPFQREEILPENLHNELESRLVLSFTGEQHSSSDATDLMMESFKKGGLEREKWLETNKSTVYFANALKDRNWVNAIEALNRANGLRCELVPDVLSVRAAKLKQACYNRKSGFGIAGAGAGGCVFALSPTIESSDALEQDWKELIGQFDGASIWRPKISPRGMRIERIENPSTK